MGTRSCGTVTRKNVRQDPIPQAAGGIFECRIDPAQARPQNQQEVGVAEQRESQEGARKAVNLRDGIDSQRREDLLQSAARTERGYERNRANVAGDNERDDRKHAPKSAEREIGPNREPSHWKRQHQ